MTCILSGLNIQQQQLYHCVKVLSVISSQGCPDPPHAVCINVLNPVFLEENNVIWVLIWML